MDLDKAPYFVAFAVAIAGWSATYVVGRINSAPTLEFEVKSPTANPVKDHPAAKSQQLIFTNLTLSTTFKDLSIEFQAPAGTRFVGNPEILPRQPAFEGNDPWKLQGGLIRYDVHRMHPGWQFVVNVTYEGDRAPVLRLESEEPVYATSPTWETWIVRHETYILGAIAAAWVLLIAPFLFVNGWQWLKAAWQPKTSVSPKTAEQREGSVDDTG